MDYFPPFSVSQEDFLLFHKMDRDLYSILLTDLSRDPTESIQAFSMWLWLERVGFRNTVKKIMSLPHSLINEVADETIVCLTYMNKSPISTISSSKASGVPILQSLMDKEISLQFFYENRLQAIQGMVKVRQEVCLRAFSDIMQQAMLRNTAERMVETQKLMVSGNNNFSFGFVGPSNTRLGGNVGGAMSSIELVLQNNNNHGGGVEGGGVPADGRTLFLTFSKGYRVEEQEVKEFFTKTYGDCIEALYMQEVQPNEQALFARIVFHKVSTIDLILRGATKVRFSINGKHVWARKFVPKQTTAVKNNFLPSSLGDQTFGSSLGQI